MSETGADLGHCAPPAAHVRERGRLTWQLAALWAGMAAIYAGLVAWGARGLRGTDQWWYVTDLVMARAGRAGASNFIFPGIWWDPQWSPDNLPPRVHNVPVVSLATIVDGLVSDPYRSWVITNAALGLVCAALTYLVARYLLRPYAATVAAALVLFSGPFTVWFALNPLMEQSLIAASLVVLLGGLWYDERPVWAIVLMASGTAWMTASRPTLILVAGLVSAFLIVAGRGRPRWWRYLVAYVGVTVAAVLAARFLWPSSPIFALRGFLLNTYTEAGQAGSSIPLSDFADRQFSLSGFIQRTGGRALGAVIPANASEILGKTATTLLFVFGALTAPRSRASWTITAWGIAMLSVFALTSALFQSQYRYLAPLLPVAAVLAVAGGQRLAGTRQRLRWLLGVGSITASLVVSAYLTLSYVQSLNSDRASMQALAEVVHARPAGSMLVLPQQGSNDFPASVITLGYLTAPDPLVLGPLGQNRCLPADLVARWGITSVIAAAGTTSDRVTESFCDPDSAPTLTPLAGTADVEVFALN